MKTLRSTEGYLLLDNRHAPPVDAETIRRSGKHVVVSGGVFESATYTCSHCNAIVVVNSTRTRERTWCRSCDHIICDSCSYLAQTQACVPMARRLEEAQTAAVHALGKG